MASLISNFDSRKRIWLTMANGLLVILLSLFVVPANWLPGLIKFGSMPILAIALVLFAVVLARQLQRLPKQAFKKRFSKAIILIILAAAGFQFVHEDFGYKILMDEYNLTATSLNMHENKIAYTPTRGLEIQGDFEFVEGYIDKRPFLFPFLVSIIHDLTGYRASNPHLLNGLLTVTLFFVIYLAGFHLGEKRGGVLSILLLAGLPLLGQNATGAGFELLNFLLIALTLFLSLSMTARPGLDKETLLVMSVMLLVHVRYESLLFLGPVILLLAFRWKANNRIGPGWITTFSPWLLAPLLLQNRWFRSQADLWELGGEGMKPFSLSYIPENVGHAVMYFFNWSAEFPNSLLLTVLGFISLFFLIVISTKRIRNWLKLKPRDYDVLGLWGLTLTLHLLVILAYHAGKLDSHFATRLGFPIHLILILAPVWFLVKEKKGPNFWNTLLAASVIFLITISAPHSSQAIFTKKNFIEREFRWAKELLEKEPNDQFLIIDSHLSHWLSFKKQSMLIGQARVLKESISIHHDSGKYREVFVLQRIELDPVQETTLIRAGDELPGFELEVVGEYISKPFQGVRLSRLIK